MKLYEVTFYNVKGEEVLMYLHLSDEVAAMNLHPKRLISKEEHEKSKKVGNRKKR